MKESLLISGCSWSCGEWCLNNENKLVLGRDIFKDVLSEKFNVLNISKGGNSNWQSLYAISNFSFYPSKTFRVILFQTDPARMMLSDYFGISKCDIQDKFLNIDKIEYFFEYLTEVFYYKVEEIIKKTGVNINLVGGLTDLLDLKNEFPTINFFCDSWQSLMIPKFEKSCVPLQIESEWFELALKHKKYHLCDQIEEHNIKNFDYYNRLMCSEKIGAAFSDFHPNKKGFDEMANYILDNILK